MNEQRLQGRCILVVEDEYFIAEAMQAGLESEGAVVIGPAPTVRKAIDLLGSATRIDVAVLDMKLGDEPVFDVAEALQARGVPFLFTTGYDATDVPPAWRHIERLQKPIEMITVTRALAQYCSM